MKKSVVTRFAMCGMVLATTAIGCKPATDAHPASLSASMPKAAKGAARAAGQARQALAAKQADKAVGFAETAVSLVPQDARYRQLLGQAYLAAGRFASAQTSFADALALDPSADRVRINLALAEIATGRTDAARVTLADATGKVPEADRGLALALAGDPKGAVRVLEAAARVPGADAKTRQNLAFAYALNGDWAKAQVTAGQDLSPVDTDRRMTEWAKLAHPHDQTTQVASLLGVVPAIDAGQPERLALVQPSDAPVEMAAAEPAPAPTVTAVADPLPSEPAPALAAAEPKASLDLPPSLVADAAAPAPVFYPAPVAKPALPPLLRAPRGRARVVVADASRVPFAAAAVRRVAFTPVRQAKGDWVVQLGAFSQRTPVEAAWGKVMRQHRQLAGYTPSQSVFTANSGTFNRLALAGFASRDSAMQVCEQVRATGGVCFVRATAGDAPVQMAARKRPIQVASR